MKCFRLKCDFELKEKKVRLFFNTFELNLNIAVDPIEIEKSFDIFVIE